MSRLLVFTLGFDERFAVRSIIRHGLDSGDKVLLITSSPVVDRVRRAYAVVEDFIRKYCSDRVLLELFEVDASKFVSAVHDVKSKLVNELTRYDGAVINLTGGLRSLVLVVYTALMLIPRDVTERKSVMMEVEYEDGSALVRIPSDVVSAIKASHELGEERRRVLRALIGRGELTVQELAEELKLDCSTVRRHLYYLEEAGLVEVSRGRPTRARARDVALLVI